MKYRELSGYKYRVMENYSIKTNIRGFDIGDKFLSLAPDGWLYVYSGYAWDGPSGPAIDTKNFMRGSLVHDALYQCGRLGLPETWRDHADRLLVDICAADGMSKIRCAWVYWAVKTFARRAWTVQECREEILEAP
jgi:hypothetical protein